jgi:uncharacterized protein YmfQ (DUF2313 family)
LTELGGQSRAYFIGIAEQLGEPGCTIEDRFRPTTCDATCNAALVSEADAFTWRVNIPRAALNVQIMNCDDGCDSALQSYEPSLIECPLQEKKPAHTNVIFAYTG